MSSRVTYTLLKEWIGEWNTAHPDVKMVIRAYNDYYHIQYEETGETIITEKSPGLTWSSFCIWKKGYWKGYDIATDNILEEKMK